MFKIVDGVEVEMTPEEEAAIAAEWAANTAAPEAILEAARVTLIRKLSADNDAIIFDVIGNRSKEYTDAYDDAKAYAAAGYVDPVPETVSDYAEIRGQSAQWAADDVIATGDAWLAASTAIRKNRLARKEGARQAVDQAALDAVAAQWAGFVAAIRAQLGLA